MWISKWVKENKTDKVYLWNSEKCEKLQYMYVKVDTRWWHWWILAKNTRCGFNYEQKMQNAIQKVWIIIIIKIINKFVLYIIGYGNSCMLHFSEWQKCKNQKQGFGETV